MNLLFVSFSTPYIVLLFFDNFPMIAMDYLSKAEQSRIRALGKKRERDEQGRFLAEGIKVCKELLGSGLTIQYAVISDDADQDSQTLAEEFAEAGIEVCKAGSTAFERMSDAKSPQGIFCIAELPEPNDSMTDTFLALEDINDPGNLGTIIRTADWFGMQNIILGGNCADPFSPKAIRSAMGSTFHVNIHIKHSLADFLSSWKQTFSKGEILGFMVQANQNLEHLQALPPHWGIVMGSESHGISNATSSLITLPVRIDGAGSAESLNVGVATGISLHHCMSISKKQ